VTGLDELAASVERPDDEVRRSARELHPDPGSRLADLAAWLGGAQGRAPAGAPRRARLLVLADEVPARTAAVAAGAGIEVRVAGRRGPAGLRVDLEDACTADEARAALLAGAALVDEEADAGTDLLAVALPDPGLAVPAATLVGLLTRSDASMVTATGQDDAAWMAACAAARDAMRRGRPLLADQVALLAAVGGADLAVAAGVLLGAAARRTPVVLDGPVTAAAALVAGRLSFRAPDWWLAGHLSPDPAHRLALVRLSMEPVLDLGLRGDDGTGALLAVPVLRAAVS
jgi:nicotinate-nucleotide--dimethylbenzimidazole phosphoribosyltransferase